MLQLYAESVKVPLMIDSTSPECIEACLRLYGGRAIVNSINLEDGGANLERVCRAAKKYGAAVVALTIDQDGMAMTADEKVRIAGEIHDLAVNRYGLRPQDILFDITPQDTFNFQLDAYFYLIKSLDPVENIEAGSGRVPLLHVKDAALTGEATVPLGTGRLDLNGTVRAGRSAGSKWFIVEFNGLEMDDSIQAAEESFRNLKVAMGG